MPISVNPIIKVTPVKSVKFLQAIVKFSAKVKVMILQEFMIIKEG